MALFGQHWLEDDCLSKFYENTNLKVNHNWNYLINTVKTGHLPGLRSNMADIMEELDAAELQQEMADTFLEYLRPKMTWIVKKNDRGLNYYICSNCKNEEYYMAKFCPECGAKYEASY